MPLVSSSQKFLLPYRSGVGLMIVNRDNRVFVGRRSDASDAWQMPQGGIDAGENPRQAALRELGEETGLGRKKVDIVAETDGWLRYDFPDDLIGRGWRGKRYRGQEQKWFLLRFLGAESDIDIVGKNPEFNAWRWADIDEMLRIIVPFKQDVYRRVCAKFTPLLATLWEDGRRGNNPVSFNNRP